MPSWPYNVVYQSLLNKVAKSATVPADRLILSITA